MFRNIAKALAALFVATMLSTTTTLAQIAAAPGGPGNNTTTNDGDGCTPSQRCGGERCCVREKRKVRLKVQGKWRTVIIRHGWKCYTGPGALETCRRRR
jgi:hypothetical protein